MAAALRAMLREAGAGHLAVELYLVRDGRMAVENDAHMDCSGPTNVLSFPASASSVPRTSIHPASPLSGASFAQDPWPQETAPDLPATLLLSADTLHRECLLYGQDAAAHCLRLLAHGMGHVLGHDHGAEMDELCYALWLAGCAACGVDSGEGDLSADVAGQGLTLHQA